MGAQIAQPKKNKAYKNIDDEESFQMVVCEDEPEILPSPLDFQNTFDLKMDTKQRVYEYRADFINTISNDIMPRIIALHFKYVSSPVFDDMIDLFAKQNLQLYGNSAVAIVNINDALNSDDTECCLIDMRKSFERAILKNVRIVILLNSYISTLYFSDLACALFLDSDHHVPIASMTTLPILTCSESHINECQQKKVFYGLSGSNQVAKFSSGGNLNTIVLENLMFLTRNPPTHCILNSKPFADGGSLQEMLKSI